MKYYLTLLLSCLIYVSNSAIAKEIQVLWPFSVASNQANMVRALVDNANTIQTKYRFIFVSKQGAGGSLAAQSSLLSKDTILASSSSFYIRPLLYKESHDIHRFTMINTLCINQPLAIFSKTNKTLSRTSQNNFKLGVIPGSITTLVSRTISQNNKNISILEIPYKGTPESTLDMLGGHIDGSVDFVNKSNIELTKNSANILGITGTTNSSGLKTFKDQGINGLENIMNSYYIFVNSEMEESTKLEISKILYEAMNDQFKFFCENDYGTNIKVPYNNLNNLHRENLTVWADLTKSILRN